MPAAAPADTALDADAAVENTVPSSWGAGDNTQDEDDAFDDEEEAEVHHMATCVDNAASHTLEEVRHQAEEEGRDIQDGYEVVVEEDASSFDEGDRNAMVDDHNAFDEAQGENNDDIVAAVAAAADGDALVVHLDS